MPIGTGIGRNVLLQTGIPITVSASDDYQFGMIGKTIDWNLVAALSAPYTDPSGIFVPTGAKMLRYGQVLTVASGNSATNTLTLFNTPTGGTFSVTVVTGNTEQTASGLAYNISTSALATALLGLSNVGVQVAGTPGTTYSISLPTPLANPYLYSNTPVFTIGVGSLTGGSATISGSTISVTATGGTFTITLTIGANAQTTSALAYNASLATVAAAIQGLSNVGTTTVSGTAGSSYVITLPASLGNANFIANGTTLVGAGQPPYAAFSVFATEGGMVGPYDPNATDGRQNLVAGSVGILNETIVQGGLFGITTINTTQTGWIEGGHVYMQRVIQAGTGSASLAAGPTLASLLAVLPRITPFYQ
jgi:hypothetical protein